MKNKKEQDIKTEPLQKGGTKNHRKKGSFFDTKLSKEERNKIYNRFDRYFQNLHTWQEYAKEFVETPFSFENTEIIDMRKWSPDKKAGFISYLIKRPSEMNRFYKKACFIMHKKYNFEKIDCVSYVSFVSTFAKLLNPQNDVVIYFGTVITTKSPEKEQIGKCTEHFWVTINGKLFDNSRVDGFSFKNYKAVLKCTDFISGNFDFDKII